VDTSGTIYKNKALEGLSDDSEDEKSEEEEDDDEEALT
jgi:hypothetical protein